MGGHYLSNGRRRSPNPHHLANVRNRHGENNRPSRQRPTEHEVPVAEQERAGVPVVRGNHAGTVGRGLATGAPDPPDAPDPNDAPEDLNGRRGRYSKNRKDTILPKPWHIGFYPRLWQQLLEIAKAEMRRALFCNHPFLPDKQTAIDGECYEVLLGVITRYEREQRPVEKSKSVFVPWRLYLPVL